MRAGVWIAASLVIVVTGCSGGGQNAAIERHKQMAVELRENGLYEAAIAEYEKILALDGIDDATRGSVSYLIGRLYFENVGDYEQAAAYYVKAKALNPDGDYVAEASKNLVTALERSGNTIDARRQLQQLTSVAAEPEDAKDVEIARIGDSPVWLSQLDDAIEMLPGEAQEQYLSSREAKVAFMHQYVSAELLYHAALREGYDNDREIKRRMREVNRQMLVEKYVMEKVLPQIKIDTVDVRNFYLANKDTRYGGAPYDSVQARVVMDYQAQKTESAFREYIDRLAQQERVQFLDANVK